MNSVLTPVCAPATQESFTHGVSKNMLLQRSQVACVQVCKGVVGIHLVHPVGLWICDWKPWSKRWQVPQAHSAFPDDFSTACRLVGASLSRKSTCVTTWLLKPALQSSPQGALAAPPHHRSSSADLERCLCLTSQPSMETI